MLSMNVTSLLLTLAKEYFDKSELLGKEDL